MLQAVQFRERTFHILLVGNETASLRRSLEKLQHRFPFIVITTVQGPEQAQWALERLPVSLLVAVLTARKTDLTWLRRLSSTEAHAVPIILCFAEDVPDAPFPVDIAYDIIYPDDPPERLYARVATLVEQSPSRTQEDASSDFFVRQSQALFRLITSPIFARGNLDEALSTITRLGADLLGVARVSVWRLLEDGRTLESLWAFDRDQIPPPRSRLDLQAYPRYREALETSRVVAAQDVSRDPRTAELSATYWNVLGIRASIDAPIRVRGRIVGVLCCEHRGAPRDWRPEEIHFVNHLSDLVGQAFLYAENERRVREVTLLGKIISATALADNLQEAMERVCAELAHFFGAPQAAFALLNPQGTVAEVIAEYRQPGRPSALNETIPVEGNPSMACLIEHRQPLAIPDAQHDPLLEPVHDLMRRRGTVSLLLIPITVGQRVVGTLGIDMVTRYAFTQEDLTLAQHVAAQIGQTLERLNLLNNMKRRTQQLTRLALLGEQLNRPLNKEEVVSAVGQGILELTGADRAAIFLIGDEGTPYCAWVHNLPPEYPEVVMKNLEKLPGFLTRTQGLPFMIPDIKQATNFPFLQRLAQRFHYRAIGILPLIYEGQVIGAVSCYFEQPHIWEEDEVQMLYTFARQAAVALKNAHLFETERRRRAQLEALRQASLQLTSSLDLRQVLRNIVQHVASLSRSDDVHIFLLEGEKLRFGVGLWGGKLQDKPLAEPRPHGTTYTVARTGKRIVIPSVNEHPLYRDWQWGGAIASFPLRSGSHIVGVMNVAFEHPHRFTEEELHILELLADQAAIAIQNARLVRSLQERINQLSVIARASTALRGAADVKEVAADAMEHALQLVAADVVLVHLVDEDRQQALPIGSKGLLSPEPIPLNEGIVGQVIRTQRPYRTDDLVRDVHSRCQHFWQSAGIGPGLSLPLRTTNGHIVGILTVARKQSSPPFTANEEALLTTLAEMAANALQRALSHAELEAAYLEITLALARAVDVRDTYTSDHSERMADLAVAVARRIGLDEEAIHHIRLAALLHDIGKIGVPDTILHKPGPLIGEEWAIMKKHPEIGAEIVAPIRKLRPVAEIILAHQERYDGSGYPRGLKGTEIPLGARILAVVDAYSAMTEDRVYRKAMSPEEAIAELKRCAGTHFDPQIVEVLLHVLEEASDLIKPKKKDLSQAEEGDT